MAVPYTSKMLTIFCYFCRWSSVLLERTFAKMIWDTLTNLLLMQVCAASLFNFP